MNPHILVGLIVPATLFFAEADASSLLSTNISYEGGYYSTATYSDSVHDNSLLSYTGQQGATLKDAAFGFTSGQSEYGTLKGAVVTDGIWNDPQWGHYGSHASSIAQFSDYIQFTGSAGYTGIGMLVAYISNFSSSSSYDGGARAILDVEIGEATPGSAAFIGNFTQSSYYGVNGSATYCNANSPTCNYSSSDQTFYVPFVFRYGAPTRILTTLDILGFENGSIAENVAISFIVPTGTILASDSGHVYDIATSPVPESNSLVLILASLTAISLSTSRRGRARSEQNSS